MKTNLSVKSCPVPSTQLKQARLIVRWNPAYVSCQWGKPKQLQNSVLVVMRDSRVVLPISLAPITYTLLYSNISTERGCKKKKKHLEFLSLKCFCFRWEDNTPCIFPAASETLKSFSSSLSLAASLICLCWPFKLNVHCREMVYLIVEHKSLVM